MDRRSAIGLLSLLPAGFASSPAAACSFAVESPETFTARLPAVAAMFRAWWTRDEAAFLDSLHGPVVGEDDDRLERLRALAARGEGTTAAELYGSFFTDPQRQPRIVTMAAVSNSIFVAVDEPSATGVGPDCSGMPVLHLFLVDVSRVSSRPSGIVHLSSGEWTGHAQTAFWSAER